MLIDHDAVEAEIERCHVQYAEAIMDVQLVTSASGTLRAPTRQAEEAAAEAIAIVVERCKAEDAQVAMMYGPDATKMEQSDNSNARRRHVSTLVRWIRAVCRLYGLNVNNFTSSLADGTALCCLVATYSPSLLPPGDIALPRKLRKRLRAFVAKNARGQVCVTPTQHRHPTTQCAAAAGNDSIISGKLLATSLQLASPMGTESVSGVGAGGCVLTFSPGPSTARGKQERLHVDARKNWALLKQTAHALNIPSVPTHPAEVTSRCERAMIGFASHLCHALLNRKKIDAVIVLQRAWRAIRPEVRQKRVARFAAEVAERTKRLQEQQQAAARHIAAWWQRCLLAKWLQFEWKKVTTARQQDVAARCIQHFMRGVVRKRQQLACEERARQAAAQEAAAGKIALWWVRQCVAERVLLCVLLYRVYKARCIMEKAAVDSIGQWHRRVCNVRQLQQRACQLRSHRDEQERACLFIQRWWMRQCAAQRYNALANSARTAQVTLAVRVIEPWYARHRLAQQLVASAQLWLVWRQEATAVVVLSSWWKRCLQVRALLRARDAAVQAELLLKEQARVDQNNRMDAAVTIQKWWGHVQLIRALNKAATLAKSWQTEAAALTISLWYKKCLAVHRLLKGAQLAKRWKKEKAALFIASWYHRCMRAKGLFLLAKRARFVQRILAAAVIAQWYKRARVQRAWRIITNRSNLRKLRRMKQDEKRKEDREALRCLLATVPNAKQLMSALRKLRAFRREEGGDFVGCSSVLGTDGGLMKGDTGIAQEGEMTMSLSFAPSTMIASSYRRPSGGRTGMMAGATMLMPALESTGVFCDGGGDAAPDAPIGEQPVGGADGFAASKRNVTYSQLFKQLHIMTTASSECEGGAMLVVKSDGLDNVLWVLGTLAARSTLGQAATMRAIALLRAVLRYRAVRSVILASTLTCDALVTWLFGRLKPSSSRKTFDQVVDMLVQLAADADEAVVAAWFKVHRMESLRSSFTVHSAATGHTRVRENRASAYIAGLDRLQSAAIGSRIAVDGQC